MFNQYSDQVINWFKTPKFSKTPTPKFSKTPISRDAKNINYHQKLFFVVIILTTLSLPSLVTICSCAPLFDNDGHETTPEELQNATNWFIDDVIDAFRESLGSKIDPLSVPEQSVSFEKDLIVFTLKGDASITDSVLTGLSSFKRTSDAYMGRHLDNGQMYVAVMVGVDDLLMRSKVKITVFGATIKSDLWVNIDHIEVGVQSYLDSASGKPVIDEIKVSKMEGINVELPSLGRLASKLIDLITSAFISIFKSTLKEFIEDAILKAANKAIKSSSGNIFSRR